MSSGVRRMILTTIAVVAVAMSGCGGSAPAASSSGPSIPTPTVPVPLPTTSVPPSAEPSPSGVSVLGAADSGAFGPGTYTTTFQPPLTFTLVDQTIVGANGTIAYESIGEVDANMPAWIDIAFGFDKPGPHGTGAWSGDFGINRIDKVFDPRQPGTLIDPPKDLATWIMKLPGLTVAAPPKAIEIGGLDGAQFDVVTGNKDVTIGPIPGVTEFGMGFGRHRPARIVVISVDGHQVLITVGAEDNSADHFKRVVGALQPLVDSIVWQ